LIQIIFSLLLHVGYILQKYLTFHQEKIAAKQRDEDKESAHLRSLANEQYQNELLDNYIKVH
jgi:hypothetical protein